MKIKMYVSCSGLDFSYVQGEIVEAKTEIAKDLISAGYAEEVKTSKIKEGGKDADA